MPGAAAVAADAMPLGVSLAFAVLLLGTAAGVGWVGVRALAGRLDRRRGLGLRTPRTLASDRAWEAGHRAAGPWLVAAALSVGVPGLLLLARPDRSLGSLLVLVGTGLLVALVAVAALLADRAAVDP